ncbi:MAG: S26 family signal peptidase [Chloroflexota bacterium]
MALTESNAPQPSFHDTPTAAERKQPTELVVREIIETLLLTFFIFWLVNSFVGRYRIDGSSMNPTLENGQYLLINNFSYYLNEPEHGGHYCF